MPTNLYDIYKQVCTSLEQYEKKDGYLLNISHDEHKDWKYKEELARDLEDTLGLKRREPRTIFCF